MKEIIICLIHIIMVGALIVPAAAAPIQELQDLDSYSNKMVKSIRNDVKKSIYVIKSRRSALEMPELKFYTYSVKKGDTFWSVLAKCSLDIDTLLSVNGFSTPKDVAAGKKMYIPNMRGIIISGDKEGTIQKILHDNMINPEYVFRTNRCSSFNKKYIFIPCGKVSNLERSLFLGTGFMYPLPSTRSAKSTSGFGMRRSPFDHRYVEFHAGVDVGCPRGSHVLAARDGKVVFTGFHGGYGNLVVVEHEHGYRSFYGHLGRPLVKIGDTVKRGSVIALSGNTGRTTGPHLHFEVRRGTTPVHPGVLLHD